MNNEDIAVVIGTAVTFVVCVLCLIGIRRALKRGKP